MTDSNIFDNYIVLSNKVFPMSPFSCYLEYKVLSMNTESMICVLPVLKLINQTEIVLAAFFILSSEHLYALVKQVLRPSNK